MSAARGFGFTLVELLVVLAIAAGAAALVASGWRAASERNGALAVLTELRTARARAIAERRETAWLPRALPGGSAIAGEPVRFFADGGSSGAEITLGAGPRRTVIEVDWLTGRAALRRAAP
jgi:general secretion pathway protein H